MLVVSDRIRKVINKVSLYTLCTFALPLFAYTSSFEMPACVKKHNFEIDSLLKNRLVKYTQTTSKVGFRQRESFRNSSILNDLIFLILGHLRSANYGALAQPKIQLLKLLEYIKTVP